MLKLKSIKKANKPFFFFKFYERVNYISKVNIHFKLIPLKGKLSCIVCLFIYLFIMFWFGLDFSKTQNANVLKHFYVKENDISSSENNTDLTDTYILLPF